MESLYKKLNNYKEKNIIPFPIYNAFFTCFWISSVNRGNIHSAILCILKIKIAFGFKDYRKNPLLHCCGNCKVF